MALPVETKMTSLYIRTSGKEIAAPSPLLKRIQGLGKICCPVSSGYMFCEPAAIVYLKAESNYTTIHFSNGEKKLLSKTLKEMQSIFPGEFFVRIHKSYLVNISFITGYDKSKLKHSFILGNGEYLPIGRSHIKTL